MQNNANRISRVQPIVLDVQHNLEEEQNWYVSCCVNRTQLFDHLAPQGHAKEYNFNTKYCGVLDSNNVLFLLYNNQLAVFEIEQQKLHKLTAIVGDYAIAIPPRNFFKANEYAGSQFAIIAGAFCTYDWRNKTIVEGIHYNLKTETHLLYLTRKVFLAIERDTLIVMDTQSKISWKAIVEQEIYAIENIGNGKIATSERNGINLYKAIENNKVLRKFVPLYTIHNQQVYCMRLVDPYTIVTTGSSMCTWDLRTGKNIMTIKVSENQVKQLVVLNSRYVASCSNLVQIWDLRTGECKASLEGDQSVSMLNETTIVTTTKTCMKVWPILGIRVLEKLLCTAQRLFSDVEIFSSSST
jgi:WD40 repeat protein